MVLFSPCITAEWQLRSSFFGAVAAVGPYAGRDALDVFLLPCLEQVRPNTPYLYGDAFF